MRRITTFAALSAAALALSACQTELASLRPAPSAPSLPSIEGRWVDENGIVSTFTNGTFETRTTDTGQLLADGTYVYRNPRLVEINLRSRVRGTTARVNCALVAPSQLNCTQDTGTQFSLTRA